jgi:uncharacterized protein (TIRG00374 family)
MLKRLLSPRYIVMAVFAISVVAALLAFGNIHDVLALMATFPHSYLLWFFLLTVGYEIVRGAQWHFLLRSLDITPPLSIQIFAYLTSEVTKLIPIGNYFENYILERAEGTDIGRSSAATTLSVLIEVGVSLVGVVILGLGTWSSWLRPLIVIGLLVFGALAWLLRKRHLSHGLPSRVMEHPAARLTLEELRRFRQGAADLLDARVIAIATALGVVYLVVAGTGLYLVVLGLGVSGISYGEALAVYFFSLAFSLIFPLPVDIGVLELSATGAWLAVGLGRTVAVSIALTFRVLSLASSLLIAVIGMAVLHNGLRRVLRGPRGQVDADDTPQGGSLHRRPAT